MCSPAGLWSLLQSSRASSFGSGSTGWTWCQSSRQEIDMVAKWKSRAGWWALLGLIVLATAWFAWPKPIPVDIAAVFKGPMEVTVDEEAKTRVRHVYTVSAPVAGKVLRISHPLGEQGPSIHVGDQVK